VIIARKGILSFIALINGTAPHEQRGITDAYANAVIGVLGMENGWFEDEHTTLAYLN